MLMQSQRVHIKADMVNIAHCCVGGKSLSNGVSELEAKPATTETCHPPQP